MYALGLGYPTSVRIDDSLDYRAQFDGQKSKDDGATYVYEFAARGSKPPVTVYWYEGDRLPKLPDSLNGPSDTRSILRGGCLLVGGKNSIHSPGMRPDSPRLVTDWDELKRALAKKTLTRALGNPVKEIVGAIKGEIKQCGSNFDYAVPLTEIVLLGTIALRSGKTMEYIPESMTFKDPSFYKYIEEPVRKGWEYGEGLI